MQRDGGHLDYSANAMSQTIEIPEAQDEGWLPTIQDDIDRLRDMVRCNGPDETCHLVMPRSSFEPCPPARRNACILPLNGDYGPACPLRLCHDVERIPYWLERFDLSLDGFLTGDCAPIATDLMLTILKRRCVATLRDANLAAPKSPDARTRWAGVLDRNSSRIDGLLEDRFSLLRDLKAPRRMPKLRTFGTRCSGSKRATGIISCRKSERRKRAVQFKRHQKGVFPTSRTSALKSGHPRPGGNCALWQPQEPTWSRASRRDPAGRRGAG
jgi:hypothetical protein